MDMRGNLDEIIKIYKQEYVNEPLINNISINDIDNFSSNKKYTCALSGWN
jgi:hypothetical protein